MKIGKLLEQFVKSLRLTPKIYLKYKTLKPSRVSIPNANTDFIINPKDERARKKLLYDAVRKRYPINRRFWNSFVDKIKPDLALDIGANYGECIFSPIYNEPMHAVAFEANPELVKYLEQTRQLHPSTDRIEIINALVDKQPGDEVEFFINENWSGGSTAIAEIAQAAKNVQSVKVKTVSVDASLQERNITPSTLVFKIDVEGYEPYVLLGMLQTIDNTINAFGFVEFNSGFLEKSGWTADKYQKEALSQFDLYVPKQKNSTQFRKITSLKKYCDERSIDLAPEKDIHFDLLLVKQGSNLNVTPDGWTFE